MSQSRRFLALVACIPLLLAGGCTRLLVRNMAPSAILDIGRDRAAPWFLASEDADLVCAMGEGMSVMVFPFGEKVDRLVPMLSMASAMCAEERAQEQELRYLRAMRSGDSEEARDARSLEQRWLLVAARRNYAGYRAAVRAFGEPGTECPNLDERNDSLSYLLGLLAGMQAFELDLATGGTLGVPGDTPSKVIAGAKCLPSEDYWGLPDAMRAMSKMMLAASAGDKDAFRSADAVLQQAAHKGEGQGVRLVQAFQASLYARQGKTEKTKQVIREHVRSKRRIPSNPRYRLLDSLATRRLTLISDRLWTQATGHRTPYNKLGTFWDDAPEPATSLRIEELLPTTPSDDAHPSRRDGRKTR